MRRLFLWLLLVIASAGSAACESGAAPPATPTADPRAGSTRISEAEAKWNSSGISTYQLTGTASWASHEHAFQIIVLDGQLVDSTCELAYDELNGAAWCLTDFQASAYTMPALFARARELLATGDRLAPGENCFQAGFDASTGVPLKMSLDCPPAQDQGEQWQMEFIGGGA